MRKIFGLLAIAALVGALFAIPPMAAQQVTPTTQVLPVQINPAGQPLTLQTAWTVTSTGGAQANTCTQAASAGKTNYCTGFEVTGSGATAASAITVTLASGGTTVANYTVTVPAGATAATPNLIVTFNPPLVGLAPGQNMVLTVPSFGAGNTNASATLHGFTQ